jgi:hypothetical protein
MQSRVAVSTPADFVLSGRPWLNGSVAVTCLAAAVYLYETRDHPSVGLHYWTWRAAGISLRDRQDFYAVVFSVVALACLVWTIFGPIVARRVVVASASVTIYSTRMNSSNPIVIPFSAIRDAGQLQPRTSNGRPNPVRRADRIFHFSANGRDFDFRRFAFRSDFDFERFCQLILNRIP